MTAIGGSVSEYSIAGRDFAVAADGAVGVNRGGPVSEVQPNGNQTARIIIVKGVWSLNGIPTSIDDDNGDMEFLDDIAATKGYSDVTITLVSGAVLQGRGTVTGERVLDTATATAPITIMGQGKLTKQA